MQDDGACAQDISDAKTIKLWLESGISPVIPGVVFRTRIVPMGNTLFYDEISKGNLIAKKVAGKTCIEIEEAVRYKRSLPRIDGRDSNRRAPAGKRVA
jgi:hypothetical protein